MPPSAMTGTPLPAIPLTVWYTAVICGTPTPEMTRVVQIDPGPIPDFTPSAPASTRCLAPSAVATLPAITSIEYNRLISLTVASTLPEWPCEESTTSTSTPA